MQLGPRDLAVLVLVACTHACDATDEQVLGSTALAGGGGTGGAGGGAAGFDATGGGGSGPACLEVEVGAEPATLDMFVLLDRSSSMGAKWTDTIAALSGFVADPASAGIRVALTFFPLAGLGDPSSLVQTEACKPSHYHPPHVALGELPAHTQALLDAMAGETAEGPATTMFGALVGTYAAATDYLASHPAEVVVVVLASDGAPNGCPGNQNEPAVIAALAKDAWANAGVRTFSIAIAGAALPTLDLIAAEGGTSAAYDVTSDTKAFAKKMEEIRAAALPCDVVIPEPAEGPFDPLAVNVVLTPGGGAPQKIPKVASPLDCAEQAGWHYDDAVLPKKIVLCPATCVAAQADADAKLAIAFGCPTLLK
jgi:hypothetical protein